MIMRRTKVFTSICYLFIQSIACFCAAAFLKLSIPFDVHEKIMINEYKGFFNDQSLNKMDIFLNEGVGSFFLVFCFVTLLWDNNLPS